MFDIGILTIFMLAIGNSMEPPWTALTYLVIYCLVLSSTYFGRAQVKRRLCRPLGGALVLVVEVIYSPLKFL